MDYKALVDVDLDFGHRLVADLEREGIHIAVAFWAKLEEYGQWRFFLASPDLDKMGLFQAYGRVAGAGHAERVFNQRIVTILDMDDPIVKGLKKTVVPDEYARGLRLGGQTFGARAIEDGILEHVA